MQKSLNSSICYIIKDSIKRFQLKYLDEVECPADSIGIQN